MGKEEMGRRWEKGKGNRGNRKEWRVRGKKNNGKRAQERGGQSRKDSSSWRKKPAKNASLTTFLSLRAPVPTSHRLSGINLACAS